MPQWQNLDTKKLFGTVDLDTFETPWVGGSFSQVLGRMEQDATCAGNSFWYNAGSLVRSDRVNLARLYAGCRNDFYVRAQDEPVFDFTESSYTVEPARVFMTTVTNGLFTLELGFHEDEFEKNSNWAIRAAPRSPSCGSRGSHSTPSACATW